MFIPMIDLPAVEYVAFQPTCEKGQTKQYPSAPGRNDNCANNCSVTRVDGTVVYGYRDYFLGYSVCFRCFVPRGRGAILENPVDVKMY